MYKNLEIKPFEEFVGEDRVFSYVAIRADEDRQGYVSTKPNITAVFPFKEDGIAEADVYRILEESGLGKPKYYEWRTRSGCYFCFFQRKVEWVGLLRQHPDLYAKAMEYEKVDSVTGNRFTWNQSESLEELARPERIVQIEEQHELRMHRESKRQQGRKLYQVFANALDDESSDEPCVWCHS